MIYEFVDSFRYISVGDIIKIKLRYLRYVPNSFRMHIKKYGQNLFVVRSIQEIDDDNAIICVNDVNGVLEFNQIRPYKVNYSMRVINC